ncbi:MAG: hypothetical protein H7A46_07745 [Verrucomicrobiales bacterium]|nr:hypothetical protein [Verrucomicrobiales bacterium]
MPRPSASSVFVLSPPPSVCYLLQPNPEQNPRSGTITIADRVVTITQAGADE